MRCPRKTGVAIVSVLALSAALAVAPAADATPLLPLPAGQLTVLLGQSGEWQPQSGAPLTLTLLAGPARSHKAQALTAYVALQPANKTCARTPAGDHEPLLDLGAIYASSTLVSGQSSFPLAPAGGAESGVHAVSVSTVKIGGPANMVRACTWLDSTPKKKAPATVQQIPLLNGLFAAAVQPSGSPATGYSLDAMSLGNPFSYTVNTSFCGKSTSSGPTGVAAGQAGAYSVSISSIDCPTDATTFAFSKSGGSSLGSIAYSDSNAGAGTIAHAGGCELDGLAGLSRSAAQSFVHSVGCSVGRTLTAPFSATLARGAVLEAQVDGGIAPIAPAGTPVDLVING